MKIIRAFVIGLILTPLAAMADVTLVNQAFKIVLKQQQDGSVTEEWQSLDKIVPGDIVGYRIEYANTGTEAATSVAINNPIPEKTTYIANSATGLNSKVTYSADNGQAFARAAELFVVKDGKQQLARPEEITHIRWNLDAIAPASKGTVEFKVRVN
ncbi:MULTISPECIES: hypothetical protein [Oceanospirillaceae]|jgi:uncharacterized repeat protein (TIGR01451 family)|uniref:DUF11 domain-containing protein n=1 Tax=Oceanobacter antarcticus TaxID=3133425 RepID=A0ABW8NJ37_9GAMM|tara:strand:- start:82439 stop:82906 length:468 start_codon:yes stop_codon:yes gene_type:complete